MDGMELLGLDELLALARMDLRENRLEAALLKLRRISADATPTPPDVTFELGRVHARLGLRDLARSEFAAYSQSRPDDLLALFELGMVEFEDGRLAEAEVLWKQVMLKAPQFPPATYYLAVIRIRQGQPGEARRLLESLLGFARPDNLYVERTRRLLNALVSEAGLSALTETEAGSSSGGPPNPGLLDRVKH